MLMKQPRTTFTHAHILRIVSNYIIIFYEFIQSYNLITLAYDFDIEIY